MQRFMGIIFTQIKALKQPSKLLQTDASGELTGVLWPGEFVTLQALLLQAETVAVPVQRLDLGAWPVGEYVQSAGKGAQTELELPKRRQAVNALSEVNRFAAQVDLLDAAARVHQCPTWLARSTAASHCGSGRADISSRAPPVNTKVQAQGAAEPYDVTPLRRRATNLP